MLREVSVYKTQNSYQSWIEADNQRYLPKASRIYPTVRKEAGLVQIVPTKMLRGMKEGFWQRFTEYVYYVPSAT